MKANPKRIFVLILALVLALGMISGSFSEESVPGQADPTPQPNASGVPAEGKNILLLISDDEEDTVLEDHSRVVQTAVAIFASAFEGTDTTLTLQPVSEKAEARQILPSAEANADPADKPDIAGTVDEAFDAVKNNANATSNKLDSQLCLRLKALSEPKSGYDCIILITNGMYEPGDNKPYTNNDYAGISLPLTVLTLYSDAEGDKAQNIVGVAGRFGGKAANVPNANALTLANQMLIAAGLPELAAYQLPADSKAESLMDVCGYLVGEAAATTEADSSVESADGTEASETSITISPNACFAANQAGVERIVVGTVKDDLQLKINYIPATEDSTDAAGQDDVQPEAAASDAAAGQDDVQSEAAAPDAAAGQGGVQPEGAASDAAAVAEDSQSEETASDAPIQIEKGSDATFSAEASEGLTLTWKLVPTGSDGETAEEIAIDANGPFSTANLEDGTYTLTLTGTCDELNIPEEAKSVTFRIVSPPEYAGNVKEGYEAKNSPDNPDVFVTELTQADSFENDDDNVTVKVKDEDLPFTAEFNDEDEGKLTITHVNNPESASDASATPASITVTLTAQNEYGLEASKDVTIKLHDGSAVIAGLTLTAEWNAPTDTSDGSDVWYTEGTEITANVTLDEDSAEQIASNSDWANSITVMVSTDGNPENATELEGNSTDGWTYTATTATGMPALTFYINGNPAGTLSAPTVYPEDKLTRGLLQGSTLTAEPNADSYELNAGYTITVCPDNLETLQGAPDWAEESGKITVTCEDAEGNTIPLTDSAEDGTTGQHADSAEGDTTVRFTGSPAEGWTLTGIAHEDTTYTFKLTYDGQQEVQKEEIATIKVKPAPFYIRLACMLNGKEDWEFDDTNGILGSPDMLRVYIAAGILLLLIIILIVIIKATSKQRFRENASIEITVKTADRSYEGRPVELEPWGKKAVSFGSLVSSSALPPISLLMDGDVMNKITFRPVRGGVRVDNRSSRLSGGDREILTRDSNVVRLSGDQNISVIIRYK